MGLNCRSEGKRIRFISRFAEWAVGNLAWVCPSRVPAIVESFPDGFPVREHAGTSKRPRSARDSGSRGDRPVKISGNSLFVSLKSGIRPQRRVSARLHTPPPISLAPRGRISGRVLAHAAFERARTCGSQAARPHPSRPTTDLPRSSRKDGTDIGLSEANRPRACARGVRTGADPGFAGAASTMRNSMASDANRRIRRDECAASRGGYAKGRSM